MPRGLLAFHIFFAMGWFATSLIGLHLMKAYALTPPQERGDFGRRLLGLSRALDMSAIATFVSGMALLRAADGAPLSQPYMHVKLVAVGVHLIHHVIIRWQLKRFDRGEVRRQLWCIMPGVSLWFLGLVLLSTYQPGGRGSEETRAQMTQPQTGGDGGDLARALQGPG